MDRHRRIQFCEFVIFLSFYLCLYCLNEHRQSSEVNSKLCHMASRLENTQNDDTYDRAHTFCFRLFIISILVLICYESNMSIRAKLVNMNLIANDPLMMHLSYFKKI